MKGVFKVYNNLQQQQPYFYGERGGPGPDPRQYQLASMQQWAAASQQQA